MPYVIVENFKGGLDTRRHKLASAPGTLIKLQNAHITRGGEIEKRKAIKLKYALPADTFGMETSVSTIYVFGSVEYTQQMMPQGVTYQRLQSPTGSAMTSIVYSTVYGGKPFVIAKYADGGQYPFWDGAFITDWNSGIVMAAMLNNAGIAEHLRSVFSYKNAENEDYTCSVVGDKVRVTGPLGKTFEGSIYKNSLPAVKGTVVSEAKIETPSVQAKGSFVVSGGSQSQKASARYALRQHYFPNLPNAVGIWVSDGASNIVEILGFNAPLPQPVVRTTDTAAGSVIINTFTILGGWQHAQAGMSISGAGIPAGTTIVSVDSQIPHDITMSQPATATATDVQVTFLAPQVATITGFGAWDMAGGIGGDPGQRYAAAFAHYVNANSTISGYTASYEHGGGGWNKWDPGWWNLYAPQSLYETANNLDVWIEFASQPFYPGSTGGNPDDNFFDYSKIIASPYYRPGEDQDIPNGRWLMKTLGYSYNGKLTGGTFNGVSSIKVDGVEVLGSRVAWTTSNSITALNLVNQINAFVSSTEYVASLTDSNRVVLTATTGTGESVNGRLTSATYVGDAVLSSFAPFSGGKNLIAGTAQVMDFTISGTFTPGDRYSISIIDPGNADQPYQFGATRVSGKIPIFSATYKGKEYAAVGSTVYFSALNDATQWGVYDVGSGFVDMSNNFGGREDLSGIGVYQNTIAVFSTRNVQLWYFDPDPSQSSQRQVIDNTGCVAPGTVMSVGSVDLFYLSYNGVRSLRGRDSTDSAYSSDLGSPVDEILIDYMSTLTDEQIYKAKSIIEPKDGRYWISLGNKLFVLSSFSGSGINAWSEYTTGYQIDNICVFSNNVYIRSGNNIYKYGGDTGNEYDASEVVVEMPYLDANKPATYKEVKGIDLTCEGKWLVELGFDYTNPSARDEIATVTQPSFALGRITATGTGTHIGPRLISSYSGYAKLANFIIHYDDLHSKHEAG
jgi:hypothetical protein